VVGLEINAEATANDESDIRAFELMEQVEQRRLKGWGA